eukprot:TRINITY_DN22212_c0_g1_i1.p1 TRINITY_DN22212_c0_g1~~TRINITY_DN22212_c0_g1_i1.p1  ORF type:complete len:154 (+),score=19.09 TRINITY_DN22212_c0_g1_i1:63-524(+)
MSRGDVHVMRAVASAHKIGADSKKICPDDFKEGLCSGMFKVLEGSSLLGKTYLEKALVRQWLQFKENMMSAGRQEASTLQILNQSLADRTFLAGDEVTIADFVIFHSLDSQLRDMSFQEREQIVHVSRWFSHLATIQPSSSSLPLLLSRTMLY